MKLSVMFAFSWQVTKMWYCPNVVIPVLYFKDSIIFLKEV